MNHFAYELFIVGISKSVYPAKINQTVIKHDQHQLLAFLTHSGINSHLAIFNLTIASAALVDNYVHR